MDEFITTKEAARRIGVNDSRVRQLIASGLIRAEKFGGIWLVHAGKLEDFLSVERKPGRPKGGGNGD